MDEFEEVVFSAPVTEEQLAKYADARQGTIVWAKCTGPDDTPLPVDFETLETAVKAVSVKQATLVKKLELEVRGGKREGAVEGDGREDGVVAGGNITRG